MATMLAARIETEDDFDGWRDAVRHAIARGVGPEQLSWSVGGAAGDLFAKEPLPQTAVARPLKVPKAFVELARLALLHVDPERFALLHQATLRTLEQRAWVEDKADPLRARLAMMAKAVGRDIHKMRAFVRFRAIADDGGERYVAWFEPAHHIVRWNSRFFVDRFTAMRWSILTPALTLHWDGATLTEGPGATRADAPAGDPVEDAWKRYYASIFNPARVKVNAMLREMPRKYWANMPETALIGELLAGAQAREAGMIAAADEGRGAVGANVQGSWDALKAEALACTRCPLHCHATQTVFGEGPLDAGVMLVGEQPGDQEDIAGRPFVGPAGQLLDRALADAGLPRAASYVTNAVKHFKFEQRGKRRIHVSPDTGEIAACRWWLDQERALVQPKLTLALGASAARALTGKAMAIGANRGRPFDLADGGRAMITAHPSSILRVPDPVARDTAYEALVNDLRLAAELS